MRGGPPFGEQLVAAARAGRLNFLSEWAFLILEASREVLEVSRRLLPLPLPR